MDLSHVLAAAVHLAAPDATHQARRAPERRSSDAPTYADNSTTAKFAFGTPTVDGDLLLEKCLHVLKIEPSQRSHSHVEDLMRLLDLGGWLGASGGRTNLRQMARELVLREAARGDVLFHQRAVHLSFYIVLSGTVGLMLRDPRGQAFCACTYHPGEAFGWRKMETINVNRPQPAAGTAVCLTTCQFLVISKDDHHSVETSIRRRDIEQKMRFFSQHPPFEALQMRELLLFVRAFTRRSFLRMDVVCQQSDETKQNLHVILSGECRVLKLLKTVDMGWQHVDMGMLHAGDIFGDPCAMWAPASAVNDRALPKHPCSIVAASPCEIYVAKTTEIKKHETPAIQAMMTVIHHHVNDFASAMSSVAVRGHLERSAAWDAEKEAAFDPNLLAKAGRLRLGAGEAGGGILRELLMETGLDHQTGRGPPSSPSSKPTEFASSTLPRISMDTPSASTPGSPQLSDPGSKSGALRTPRRPGPSPGPSPPPRRRP